MSKVSLIIIIVASFLALGVQSIIIDNLASINDRLQKSLTKCLKTVKVEPGKIKYNVDKYQAI